MKKTPPATLSSANSLFPGELINGTESGKTWEVLTGSG